MPEAYATLLYNDEYLPGASTLAQALKDTGTDRDIVVLVTPAVSELARTNLVTAGFTSVLEVSPLATPVAAKKEFASLKRPELDLTFTKIRLWQTLDGVYDKVVFLDADCLPVKNIDELFDQDLTTHDIAASPDSGWPDIFNSGVFVTKPSTDTYDKLYTAATAGGPGEVSFDGGDQGLLNQHLSWKRIPFTFNTTPSASYQYLPAYTYFRDQVKVIHFAGNVKPWVQNSSKGIDDLISTWNAVFSKTNLGNQAKLSDAKLISAPIDKWDPSKFRPPLDTAPEAAELDVDNYSFESKPASFVYPSLGEETATLPFDKIKPERVFYNAI